MCTYNQNVKTKRQLWRELVKKAIMPEMTISLNKKLYKVHINRIPSHKFNQYTTKQRD